MYQVIKMSKKWSIALIIAWLIIIAFGVGFFVNRQQVFKRQMRYFIANEVKGKLTALGDQRRGSYYLEVRTSRGNEQFNSIPIAWEVDKYKVAVGDSISKNAGSRTVTFYKPTGTGFEPLFVYTIDY